MGYEYRKIRRNIWQIKEEEGVYCTFIQGSELAILFDTGMGNQDIRAFVEQHCKTPYLVFNSHGHLDRCLGNRQFDKVYMGVEEVEVMKHYLSLVGEEDPSYEIETVTDGQIFDLGDIQVQVVNLEGHTKGSIGLLVKQEQLLVSGDAINKRMWLVHYGTLGVLAFQAMLKRIEGLAFKSILSGRSNKEMSTKIIQAHLSNIEHLKKNRKIGVNQFESVFKGKEESSIIIYEERA
ncbi:hypothetical protein lbkm_4109 [Lachnospiraceae bacterium KM106-2]|nr:hypothetical protein lbkm_4109 [Lachnospiraceae bacterium KM106-2]